MTYTETQSSISTWASDTFGEPGTLLRVLTRANEEMAELLREITGDGNIDKVAREAADVLIVLFRVADRSGFRLVEYTPPKEYADDAPALDMARKFAVWANLFLADAMGVKEGGFTDRLPILLQKVYLSLHSACSVLGFDLLAEVDAKMAVNRARVWKKDGTGHGYHVRDKAASREDDSPELPPSPQY